MAHILLLEDSSSLRRIVTRYLRDAGHAVTAFDNGTASLDKSVLDEVDVLLTDLSMPETDGRKALSNVRRLCPDLPAIVMTGVERFPDPVLDQAYGYLQKPFSEEDLLDMVDAALIESGRWKDDMESDIESHSANHPHTEYGSEQSCATAPVPFCQPLAPVSRMSRLKAFVAALFSR